MGSDEPKKPKKTALEKLQTSSTGVSGDSLTSALQFNGQCFLIEEMHNIATHSIVEHKTEQLRPSNRPGARYAQGAQATSAGAPVPSGFKYISPILASTTYKPEQVFSKVTATKSSYALANFTPAQMAMLVPKIRIYKLVYQAKADKKGEILRINRDVEPDKQEILFDDFTRTSQLADIFKQRSGRAAGVGIKSFKWSLKGVNPAEVDANITADLVIHFNDVSQLTRAEDGNASFLDLILYNPSELKKEDFPNNAFHYDGQFFEIQAVVGWAAPPGNHNDLFDSYELQAIRESQTPLYLQLTKHQFDFNQDGSADLKISYRARLSDQEKGYDLLNVPSDLIDNIKEIQKDLKEIKDASGDDEDATEASREELEAAQKKLNESLEDRYSRLLTTLKKNGKVYNAWATPLQLRMINIDAEGQAAETPGVLIGIAMEAQAEQNNITSALSIPSTDSAEDFASDTMQMVETMVPELAQLQNDPSAWNAYLAAVATAKTTIGGAVTVPQAIAERYGKAMIKGKMARRGITIARGAQDSDNWALAYLQGDLPENTYTMGPSSVTKRKVSRDLEQITAIQDNAGKQASLLAGESASEQAEAQMERTAELGALDIREVMGLTGADEVAVPFVFVGDIIDAAIQVLDEDANGPGRITKLLLSRDFGLLMGDFRFYNIKNFYAAVKQRANDDPLAFFRDLQMGETVWSKADLETIFISVNSASIPIHFDSFIDWYVRKVVKAKRQRYFFSHFVRDLLTDLIAPALSARCFYGVPQHNVQVSQLDFPVAKSAPLEQICYPGSTPGGARWGGPTVGTQAVSIDYLVDKKIRAVPATINPDETDIGHTTMRYLNITSLRLNYMDGSYQSNIESGIQHFIVGLDRGLLKEARFERVDAPYLREARVNRNRTLGTQQLRELYNVNLKLYGTPILKPGQYIYVSPSTFGFGSLTSKKSHARMLGIGGYHLVVSVESTIGRNGYETTVKALHQALPAIY